MFTEDQFGRLLSTITCSKEDHDLLVRISTHIEQLHKSHKEDRDNDVAKISEIKGSVDAAHKRIDGVVKFHWATLGSLVTAGATFAAINFILKVGGRL